MCSSDLYILWFVADNRHETGRIGPDVINGCDTRQVDDADDLWWLMIITVDALGFDTCMY